MDPISQKKVYDLAAQLFDKLDAKDGQDGKVKKVFGMILLKQKKSKVIK